MQHLGLMGILRSKRRYSRIRRVWRIRGVRMEMGRLLLRDMAGLLGVECGVEGRIGR